MSLDYIQRLIPMKPMNYKHITLTIGFLLCALVSFGQDSIPKKKELKRLTEADFVEGETYVIDTIIDGKNYFRKSINIKPVIDSIKKRGFKTMCSQQKWMKNG